MSLDAILALVALAVATTVALVTTGVVTRWLRRSRVMDLPNERSSHTVPTPRGGGWGIMAVVVPVLVLAAISTDELPWGAVALGCCALVACSWMDDRGGLGRRTRLAVQVACVVVPLGLLDVALLPWLPAWLDRALVAVAWVWFVNLYNFMDGIDGLAAVETAAIGVGVSALALACSVTGLPPWLAASVAGAALGFLPWNWSPARVFMGDVGSIPLGYVLGFLLISLASRGHWPAAVILPAYFAFDATMTLVRRALAGKKVWEAHREHLYQAAAVNLGHATVSRSVAFANVILVGLALASVWCGWWAAASAGIVVLVLVRSWRRNGKG